MKIANPEKEFTPTRAILGFDGMEPPMHRIIEVDIKWPLEREGIQTKELADVLEQFRLRYGHATDFAEKLYWIQALFRTAIQTGESSPDNQEVASAIKFIRAVYGRVEGSLMRQLASQHTHTGYLN
jgi:hypothetical protein